MLAWFHCWLRSHHNPVRHPLGGFRCVDCGATAIDLEEMGFAELGDVARDGKRFAGDERASWTR